MTAQIEGGEQSHNKREQQRGGVRQLLQQLLNKLSIKDKLDDTQFPYQLIDNRYYVCFSHSANTVAVVLSTYRAIGVDIEVKGIAWHLVERFYHSNEYTILAMLPENERRLISKLLWQLKECFIKIHQYKLAQGLGMSYAALVPTIIDSIKNETLALVMLNDRHTSYQIAILPLQQTVVVF